MKKRKRQNRNVTWMNTEYGIWVDLPPKRQVVRRECGEEEGDDRKEGDEHEEEAKKGRRDRMGAGTGKWEEAVGEGNRRKMREDKG